MSLSSYFTAADPEQQGPVSQMAVLRVLSSVTPDASELDVRYLKALLSSMLGAEADVSLPDLVKVLNGGLDLQVCRGAGESCLDCLYHL